MTRMYACDGCRVVFDSDDFPDCFDSEGQGFCEDCIAKHNAEGRALAAEHQRDLNAQGCTCRWVDADASPYKRDDECPMHGRDKRSDDR